MEPFAWQVSGRPLNTCPLEAESGEKVFTRAHNGLHVRTGRSIHANILGNLQIGTDIELTADARPAEDGRIQWAAVDTPVGSGYVDAGYLSLLPVHGPLQGAPYYVPPSLMQACVRAPQLKDAWQRWDDFPRLLCAIGCLESNLRTRPMFGGAMVERFEPGVYKRLSVKDDAERPLRATSWGVGQVMGFHAPEGRTREWLQHMGADAANEWIAAGAYLLGRLTAGQLAQCDWIQIAEAYNGAGERKAALKAHRRPYDELLEERFHDVVPMPYGGRVTMPAVETSADIPPLPKKPVTQEDADRAVKEHYERADRIIDELASALKRHWSFHLPLSVFLHIVTFALVAVAIYSTGSLHDKVKPLLPADAAIDEALGDSADAEAIDDAAGDAADADAASATPVPATIGPAPTPADVYQYLDAAFRLHDAPDVNSNSQGTLQAGTEIKRLGCQDGFVNVEVQDGEHAGKTGWVALRDGNTASGLSC